MKKHYLLLILLVLSSFFATVQAQTNTGPTFTSTPITTVDENNTYRYVIKTNDPDGDVLSFTGQIPSWLKLTNTTTMSTLAGSVAGLTDGPGTIAKFSNPIGIALDDSGNVYVADYNNVNIRKITPDGMVSTLAGNGIGYFDGPGTEARFTYPVAVAVDASGNVYVADSDNQKIRKITPEGMVSTFAGSSYGYADGIGTAAKFYNPVGVAVDVAGNVYVADRYNYVIRKITPEGVVSRLEAAEGTYVPTGVAVDALGNVYVSDISNYRILKITPDGVSTTLAGGEFGSYDGLGAAAQFGGPIGLAVDKAGNVYVADSHNNRIRKITPAGLVITLSPELNNPTGVAVDATGTIYVADSRNHIIRKIEQITVLTGTPTSSDVGSQNVVLNVSDGKGGTAAQYFTITVNKDVTAPTITSTSPEDDATNVPVAGNLTHTFNENIVKGTGNIIIYNAEDHAVVETIAVDDVSVTDNVVTINPTSDLLKSKNYYVQIDNTAFKDVSNNTFVGITDKTTWNFSTELKANQTITFEALTYTQNVFDLTATSSSGLAINYTSSNTAVATISGKTVTVLAAGTTNITAKQAGDANYAAATDVVQPLTVVTLGVDDDVLLSKIVRLYPNPAENLIKVDIGNIEKARIKIIDIIGKQVLEVKAYKSKEALNISNLKPGVYLMKIESDTGNTIRKLIKKTF